MHTSSVSQKPTQFGYYLGVFGVALVLIWLGIYKFTPTEAKLIEPLVVNHPAMSWLYNVISVQAVSNIIGLTEIIVALGLLIGLKKTNGCVLLWYCWKRYLPRDTELPSYDTKYVESFRRCFDCELFPFERYPVLSDFNQRG